ncbi:MAG: DUF4340 domain-containing protein [Deltaproteobacteria bacterium]|nr:DUF4340 domain-containing protein [Deltaproteobacteria bacterium]
MRQTPIIVVAALFAVLLGALALGTPKPAGVHVRAESLAMGEDYAGVTLTIDRPAPEGEEEAEAPKPAEPVDPLAGAAAETPKDEHPGREIIELAYQGDKWFLKQPLEFPASTQDINRIVEQLKSLDLSEVPTTKAREELLVDDKQGIRVTAKRDGRAVLDLVVGTTIDGRTFVRKYGESTIWTVEGLKREDLTRDVDELREHQIFDEETEPFQQVTVARGRAEHNFVKKAGNWALEPVDENWLVDPTKIAGAVGALARMRASKFADGVSTDVSGLGGLFATAAITFVVQPEGKTPTTYKLLVGNIDEEKQNYYVMRADAGAPAPETVYLVAKSTIERIIGGEEKGVDDFRETRVVRDLAADKVKSVIVSLGGRTVAFDKGAGTDEWNPAPNAGFAKADGATIAGVIRKLAALRADDFVAMPGLRMGDRPVTLKELIEGFPSDIRDAIQSGGGGGSASDLELARILTGNAQFLGDMAQTYAVVYPDGAPAAAAGIQALAAELTGTYEALRDPLLALAARLAPAGQGVAVTWTFTKEDGTSLALHIGGTTADGKRPVYTDVAGDKQVYLLGTDKLGDLALEDVNDLRAAKLLAAVPADRITDAVFANAGRVWTFAHALGAPWAAAPDTVIANLDPEKLGSTIGRVLNLEAVKFVRVTPDAAGLTAPAAWVRLTWTPTPPAVVEGAVAAPAPVPLTINILVGAADPEGQRWVRIDGLDPLLEGSIFLVAKAPAADLMFEEKTVVKAEEPGTAAGATTPTGATPGEDLQQILGGAPPAPASVPTPSPAPAPSLP